MNNTTIISIVELIHEAKLHLDKLNYTEGSKQRYILKWGHLLKYAESKNCRTFSLELGYKFLESHYGIKKDIKLSMSQVFTVRTIKVLDEFMHSHNFDKCHHSKGKQVPYQFNSVLDEY